MKTRRVSWIVPVIVLVGLGLIVAACSSDDEPEVIHIEDGAVETQAAQTAWVLEHPTPTPGPSPTPTQTPTPYVIPTNAPDVDGETVITRVGNDDITLEEFQKRVRFERWRPLYLIANLAEERGPDVVLDLTRPDNSYTAALFTTLADSNGFGKQVQRMMVVESIAMQEAIRRGLDVDPYQFSAKQAEYLGMQVGEGGQLPPEFDEEYVAFLDEITTYTDLNEEEFLRIVRAQAVYAQLEFIISNEPDAVPEDSRTKIGIQVQDILVDSEDEAEAVIARLEDGEAMIDIAESLGMTSTTEDSSRVINRSDSNLVPEAIDAIFSAEPGSIVGPIEMSQGWYVARVQGETFTMLTPDEVKELRKRHFLDWVEAQMDDPDYVKDFDNWFEHIPQEPLPQDVSPLLTEEYIIVPEIADDPLVGPDETVESADEPTPEETG
ncbi:MAG: peptidyl-prolyl cis-trans isomerase [Anaerolineae bacterium]|nr:peptidyl-prolyl cis-trans isomerase [Anaerolineae bacterium]